MNIKNIITGTALCFSLFLVSCQPKDADIDKNVTENINASAPGVSADVAEGVVTLTGQVNDEASRQSAEEAAKKTKGVKSVVNNITIAVAAPVVAVTADDALRMAVTDAVKDYPGVTVSVTDGEIIVDGELAKDQWKRLKTSLDALNPRKVNAVTLKIK